MRYSSYVSEIFLILFVGKLIKKSQSASFCLTEFDPFKIVACRASFYTRFGRG